MCVCLQNRSYNKHVVHHYQAQVIAFYYRAQTAHMFQTIITHSLLQHHYQFYQQLLDQLKVVSHYWVSKFISKRFLMTLNTENTG